MTSATTGFLTLAKDLPKLSVNKAEGWSYWKDEIINTVFAADGVTKGIVNGTTKRPTDAEKAVDWDKRNTIAAAVIRALTDSNTRSIYANEDGGADIFAALCKRFDKSTFKLHHSLLHDPSQPISIFLDRITSLRDRLNDLLPKDEKVSDTYLKDVILTNLHSSYSSASGEPELDQCKTILSSAGPDWDVQEEADKLLESAGATVKVEPLESRLDNAYVARAARYQPRDAARYKNLSAPAGGVSGSSPRGGVGIPGSGGATGSHRGDGFVDRQGNRWCDMSMDGCHRCGERSHKAVSCIKEMPPEVKDWCLNRAYETAQLAADSTHFAAESTHPVASYFVQEPSAPSPSSHGPLFLPRRTRRA
ncbi:hypothetical protein R3P38DRAFT_3240099 [Favolaschia claudopus]|uniref:CCHC-type domain-containing protein n=1 Tax=Favolaschia claudopus TaxID=2862362 RepID=A0AAV9Z7N6_9AGAR